MALTTNWEKRIKEILDKAQSDETARMQFQYYPPHDDFFPSERITSWAGLERWISKLDGSWCFRGQRDAEWILTTSLDRAVRIERETDYSKSLYHLPRLPIEREYLFRFYQQAQNWGIQLPEKDDLTSWLGLMQHYGVPTRLLDWTTSPYVAAYFAVEYETPKNCAVWAIDLGWLQKQCDQWFSSRNISFPADPGPRADKMNGLLLRTEEVDHAVIVHINPWRLHPRMVAQQGVFLCKLVDQAGFSGILMSMIIHSKHLVLPPVRRIRISKTLRIAFLKKLREMNIERASLFPGLDGFGQSLKVDLEIKAAEAP